MCSLPFISLCNSEKVSLWDLKVDQPETYVREARYKCPARSRKSRKLVKLSQNNQTLKHSSLSSSIHHDFPSSYSAPCSIFGQRSRCCHGFPTSNKMRVRTKDCGYPSRTQNYCIPLCYGCRIHSLGGQCHENFLPHVRHLSSLYMTYH